MIDRLARVYVILIAIIGIAVLALTVTLHLRVLLWNTASGVPLGRLFVLNWIIAAALLGLAKERNIFANEIRVLPSWIPAVLMPPSSTWL